MRIEGIDMPAPVRPLRGPGIGRHLGGAAQRQQTPGAEAPSRPPVDHASQEPWSLRDVHAAAVRIDDGPAELTRPDQAVRMFSKLAGLWDTFREMGVFPPPKSYHGFKVVTPTEVMIPDMASPESDGEKELSAADEAAIAMVEHMLRRFVTERDSADPAVEEGTADATLQATFASGESTELAVHAELTPDAREAGGQFRPSPGEAMEVFLSQTGPMHDGPLRMEIDVEPEPPDAHPADGPDAGRAVSVWGRHGQGEKRLLAVGREGQGAFYVGHQDAPPETSSAPSASPPAAKASARGGLSPYEQAALGQLGHLDLAV